MRPVLIWTPLAEEDLLEIYSTIAADNVDAAERLYSAIQERIEMLVEYPRMGLRRPEIAPSARMLVKGMYLVLYETHPDTDDGSVERVEIVRIVHGQRDLSQEF
jgi:toxin ParE1/3/4